MPLKIAMIGAGSIGFTRRLIQDFLAVPELADTEFSLTDLSARNLDMVARLCARDIAANKLPAKIAATTDRRRALAGADYVICMIRQGGLEAFRTDVEIPLKYGVDQCVGDTICAGGLMYAQRTIPALLDFCRDIREVAKPGALFLNYANPMAMNTLACEKYGKVPTLGLCHGVQGAHCQIAWAVERWAKREGILPPDYISPNFTPFTLWGAAGAEKIGLSRHEVEATAAGLNHQTWFIKVAFRGHDMVPLLPQIMREVPHLARAEKVRLDVLDRFGYYSTESNGHLSEYLPWYRKRTAEIAQWIDPSFWIHGETGGYLRVCTEARDWFRTDYPNWMREEPPRIGPQNRSEEHGSWIIESLVTGRPYRGHFNVINRGHIPNLPDGCCIEIPGFVDRNGVQMPVVGPLPAACAATCSVSANVQLMGMEAAVHGDVTLLKQAMLHDPLVGAVCNPEEVWQMADEMLVAGAKWLPQYRSAIPAAKKRLADHVKRGTRVKLRDTRGAVRLRTKTVAEMAQNVAAARANAGAADKGGLTKPTK
ncbi:MAG: alpha-galactosidase [Opitutaceae bacterium]